MNRTEPPLETTAADRRVDAGLRELLGCERAPDVTAAVLARHAAGDRGPDADSPATSARPGRRPLLAALFVLGVGAVLGTALLTDDDGARGKAEEPPQDPKVLPLEVTQVEQIAALPRDLRAVELRNLDDAAVASLVARCPDLEFLRVHASTNSKRADDAKAVSITDAALPSIAKLTSLRTLELVGTLRVEGGTLRELAAIPLLERLALTRFDLNDRAIEALQRLPSLRELDLTLNQGFGAGAYRAIAGMPGLRRLTLTGTVGVPRDVFAELARLTQLEALDLAAINESARGIAEPSILRDFPTRLRKIRPEGALVTDCLQRWPALVELGVASCPRFEDDLAEVLRERTPALRRLDVRDCDVVDDAQLAALLQLEHLEELRLGYCERLTPTAIDTLVRCTTLRHVDFGVMPWLTLDDVERLARRGVRVTVERPKDPGFEQQAAALVAEHVGERR